MNLDMSEFISIFVEEAQEHLAAMEAQLVALDVQHVTTAELNEIFRAAHSIKGGAATFGMPKVTGVAHILESLLDRLRNRELDLTREMVDALLASVDVISALIDEHLGRSEADASRTQAVCDRIQQLAGAAGTAPLAPAERENDARPENDLLQEKAGIAFGFFDDAPEPAPASGAVPTAASVKVSPAATAATAAPVAAGGPAVAGLEQTSIRVSIEKVDQLINLVGELVITQAMLAQTVAVEGNATGERMSFSLAQLDRNTRDLQEATMAIRMMPISSVFNRFPRVVRDLASRLDKQVELKMSGETTELERGLIEKIVDPLTHLVRNSLDHGIESAAERIAAGKPASGTITLKASHQSGSIVIEVADDGRGLDRERILAKARERGMAVADNPSDADVWGLIFEAGFSTASSVTDVSGRGVGMDVVRSNIVALGGRVEISSEAGKGTRMTVRLPLTLAILDGLSVLVGEERFILPLGHIVESMRAAPGAVQTIAGRGRVLKVRGQYLPVVALKDVFQIPGAVAREEDGIIVILETDGQPLALFVDALVGQHQVVIKSLETNFRRVPGISGATILGDGRVALILDAGGIARMAQKQSFMWSEHEHSAA